MSTERSPAVKGIRSMRVRDIPLTASVTNVASVGVDRTGVAPAKETCSSVFLHDLCERGARV